MRSSGGAIDPNLGKIYGHCRLERKLGEGGMGMVYLAIHTTLSKWVAVKLLRTDLCTDPSAADRFLREARSAAKVEHPAVVQVYDIGQSEGTFYIVMQYVEGTTLEAYVKRNGALPLPEAYRIIASVCEGVREAHHCGVVHRDIKPDNILLGKDGSVKLVDFGLARAMEGDPNISQTGRVFGTPHFMSPEQALGEKVDQRSDIFSLGATFYRIVTGHYPFQATTPLAVVFKLTHETPQPARELNPALPQGVSDLIQEMMARDPEQRTGSLDEVLRRLQEAVPLFEPATPAQTSASLRASIPERARRERRRQILVACLAFAALGASGFMVFHRYGLIPSEKSAQARGAREAPDPKTAAAPVKREVGEGGAAAGKGKKSEAPKSTPPAPEPPEKKAVRERAEKFLAVVEKYPDRIANLMDPQGGHEKSTLLLERMFSFISKVRPKGSPPLTVGEVNLSERGSAAEVSLRGTRDPVVLRWAKRQGEWYLCPPKRRWER